MLTAAIGFFIDKSMRVEKFNENLLSLIVLETKQTMSIPHKQELHLYVVPHSHRELAFSTDVCTSGKNARDL